MIIKLNVLVPLERGGDICRACPGQTNNAADGGRSDPGLPLRHPSPVILFRHLCALAGLRALPRLGQVRHHFHTLLLSALLLGGAHVVRLAPRDVRIIGFRVQYFGDIKDRDVLGILLGVSKFAYFTNSLCFIHFCYKVFKAYSTNQIGGDYELMPISNPNLSNLAASQTDRSRAMKEEIRRDLAFRPFQGTGVALG